MRFYRDEKNIHDYMGCEMAVLVYHRKVGFWAWVEDWHVQVHTIFSLPVGLLPT